MKLLIIVSFITVVSLIAAATEIPRSHSGSTVGRVGTARTLTLREMQSARGADDLPDDDFEDRSLVFPRESKR